MRMSFFIMSNYKSNSLFGNFLMIKVRHNFTIINGRLAYIPQYGGEVTTTAKQHKKVPNAVGVS